MSIRRHAEGLTLVELILFILIVSLALAGVLALLNLATGRSSDPLVRKQVLAVAEALLEEVELMPFTYCDPDDPNVATATSAAACTTQEALGPEAGESRTSLATPFDNVNDYHNFSMAGITDITGTAQPGLSAYSAAVTITPETLAGTGASVPGAAALRISVQVSGPANQSITLEGYRTRFGPRTP
jgi:MSHA pilin protein MshD